MEYDIPPVIMGVATHDPCAICSYSTCRWWHHIFPLDQRDIERLWVLYGIDFPSQGCLCNACWSGLQIMLSCHGLTVGVPR